MKKIVFVFAVMIAMVTSVTMFANSNKDGYCVRNHDVIAINVAVQGPRCSGTVGCGCPGFSPITNGDVWQQAYCRHCGHRKSCHR